METRNYNKGNYDLLRSMLQDVDWSVMKDADIDQAYHFFVSSLQEAVSHSIPVHRPRANKNIYITKPAVKLKREKASLWKTYCHSRDSMDYARYCQCRNKLRSLTRQLRKDFEQRLSKELKQNPKAFWRYSNSRLKTKSGIDCLRDEQGYLSKDDHMKAIILNKLFSTVFTEEALTTIPRFELRAPHPALVQDLEITEDMVKSKLNNLKATGSPGPDQIHPRVLREPAEQVAGPLTILFKKSIESGCLPDD